MPQLDPPGEVCMLLLGSAFYFEVIVDSVQVVEIKEIHVFFLQGP